MIRSVSTPGEWAPRRWLARVLVVGESPDKVAALRKSANPRLIDVLAASDQSEALGRVRVGAVDGVLINASRLAEADPFGIAEALRGVSKHHELPIGFVAAEDSLSNRAAAAHAGACLFVEQPLDRETLETAVQRFLAIRQEREPRVLLLTDDEPLAVALGNTLSNHRMRVALLRDPSQLLAKLDKVRPDLLILTVAQPGVDGFDRCRMVRSSSDWADLAVLFITEQSTDELRLACFEAGADDYLVRPVMTEELLARIRVRLERARLHRERLRHDGLTGLLTRRAFTETFDMRLAESRRQKAPLSLCVVDLDHFKQVNDQHGHLAGDRVLEQLGRLLRSHFRLEDLRGRWGGEEIVLAFFGVDRATTRLILDRFREQFAGLAFTGDDGESFQVTFSAGVAQAPAEGRRFETLFRLADDRLMIAKNGGRNRVVID